MKKSILAFLFLSIFLSVFILGFALGSKQQRKVIEELTRQELKVSKEVRQYIKNKIQRIYFTQALGSDFIFITTIPKLCASCHTKIIYIFDKTNRNVFEMAADDPRLVWADNQTFAIIEPVRKDDEPLCCPTSHKTRVFKWDGSTFQERK